jgi:hypothetical protein
VKPEPEKVIVVPIYAEDELSPIVCPLTVNFAEADGEPKVSVKVMKYVPAAIFAMMKLPPIVPLAV